MGAMTSARDRLELPRPGCSPKGVLSCEFAFQKHHLDAFKDPGLGDCPDPDEPGMKKFSIFAKVHPDDVDMTVEVGGTRLSDGENVRRSQVFSLAARCDVNEATVCAAAMAWGGMNLHAWNILMKSDDCRWLEVARAIRRGCLDRAEAYGRLKCVRKQGGLKGMGPAFFTKLIYFLTPRDKSERKTPYIMDQWSSSSVNLLTGSDLVLLDVTRTWKHSNGLFLNFNVSDENTSNDYEAFCSAVDQLADQCCLCADKVDQALFSAGGPNPKTWRKYVVDKRPGLICATQRIIRSMKTTR